MNHNHFINMFLEIQEPKGFFKVCLMVQRFPRKNSSEGKDNQLQLTSDPQCLVSGFTRKGQW